MVTTNRVAWIVDHRIWSTVELRCTPRIELDFCASLSRKSAKFSMNNLNNTTNIGTNRLDPLQSAPSIVSFNGEFGVEFLVKALWSSVREGRRVIVIGDVVSHAASQSLPLGTQLLLVVQPHLQHSVDNGTVGSHSLNHRCTAAHQPHSTHGRWPQAE